MKKGDIARKISLPNQSRPFPEEPTYLAYLNVPIFAKFRKLTQAAREGSVQIAAFAADAATAAIAREQAEQAARDAAQAAQTQQAGTPSAPRPVTSHHRRRR